MQVFSEQAGANATMGLLVAVMSELQRQGILTDPAMERVLAQARASYKNKPAEVEMNAILDALVTRA